MAFDALGGREIAVGAVYCVAESLHEIAVASERVEIVLGAAFALPIAQKILIWHQQHHEMGMFVTIDHGLTNFRL